MAEIIKTDGTTIEVEPKNGTDFSLEELQSELQSIAEEESECFDNVTDGLQQSGRGQTIGENAYDLESADDDFESPLNSLRQVIER